MTAVRDIIVGAVTIGMIATAILDLWALYLWKAYGARAPSYGPFGRWLGHFSRGQFQHDSIAALTPIKGERLVGWAVHYVIGVISAGALLIICGRDWAKVPSPGPALMFGLATVVFPFLIMQPGMGAGFAGSKLPNPTAARLSSLGNHFVFGVALYLAALLVAWI